MFFSDDDCHFCFTDRGPELTDSHILKLSMRMTNPIELRLLAVMGLKLTAYDVQKHITNNDIQSATYGVLREWRNSHTTSRIAFQRLSEALQRSNMNDLLHILQQDSAHGQGRVESSPKIIKQSGMFNIRIVILAIIFHFCAKFKHLYYYINVTTFHYCGVYSFSVV